jgi:hypothetical protein
MNLTPEHLHLALNHICFLGPAFAMIPIAMGLKLNHRSTLLAGLLIATLSAWTTPFIMSTGEEAYERYTDGPVTPFLDPEAKDSLELHEKRAHFWSKLLYLTAGASTLALLLVALQKPLARPASLVACLLCAASLLAGIWIATSGGGIRRPDFRAESGFPAEPLHHLIDSFSEPQTNTLGATRLTNSLT